MSLFKDDSDFVIGDVTENWKDHKKWVISVCFPVFYCILKTFYEGLLKDYRIKMFWHQHWIYIYDT